MAVSHAERPPTSSGRSPCDLNLSYKTTNDHLLRAPLQPTEWLIPKLLLRHQTYVKNWEEYQRTPATTTGRVHFGGHSLLFRSLNASITSSSMSSSVGSVMRMVRSRSAQGGQFRVWQAAGLGECSRVGAYNCRGGTPYSARSGVGDTQPWR